MAILSVYMSKGGQQQLHYAFLDVTLASMAKNPGVDFLLIHVVADEDLGSSAADLTPYELETIPSNFLVHRYSYSQLSALAAQRLKINVAFSRDWSYKMAEYKPAFGHLFEHLLVHPVSGAPKYKWWGYADLDLVWGNISHFSSLFLSPDIYPIVHSGWRAPRGMAAFFVNLPWTRRELYREDPVYVRLLQNSSYMNLDENGVSCPPGNVVDGGRHSLAHFQWAALKRRGRDERVYGGVSAKSRLFLEKIDSVTWAGPVVWRDGSLLTLREYNKAGEDHFPAYREIMFYHRADDDFAPPRGIERSAWVKDLLHNGFLLPYFTPTFSQFMCPQTASKNFRSSSNRELENYRPYACLNAEA